MRSDRTDWQESRAMARISRSLVRQNAILKGLQIKRGETASLGLAEAGSSRTGLTPKPVTRTCMSSLESGLGMTGSKDPISPIAQVGVKGCTIEMFWKAVAEEKIGLNSAKNFLTSAKTV